MNKPAVRPEISLAEKLLAVMMEILPHHLLSGLMYRIARIEVPFIKNTIISQVVKHFDVDMSQAVVKDPLAYKSFNDFFTRKLETDARPIAGSDSDIASPVDGQVSQSGIVDEGKLIQAKGRYYSLKALLGGDAEMTKQFENSSFSTIYLSPRDYHRIHMPVDGHLSKMVHVPGRLFSVNHATTHAVNNLFARNERLICQFDTESGPMIMILVGAIFVGSMETVWSGLVTPVSQRISNWDYDQQQAQQVFLRKGEEMGRFNMGSTVILLFPENRAAWDQEHTTGQHVRMGQRIGGKLVSA
jgi:phosphatidylserine decarboxylase